MVIKQAEPDTYPGNQAPSPERYSVSKRSVDVINIDKQRKVEEKCRVEKIERFIGGLPIDKEEASEFLGSPVGPVFFFVGWRFWAEVANMGMLIVRTILRAEERVVVDRVADFAGKL